MNVFLTGSDGYIGSLVTPFLVSRGHSVVGFDTGFYREGLLYSDGHTPHVFPPVISKDMRPISAADLTGVDCVVPLAEV